MADDSGGGGSGSPLTAVIGLLILGALLYAAYNAAFKEATAPVEENAEAAQEVPAEG